MAYYKLQMDIWCDWDPEESDFGDIAQNMSSGDAICVRRKVIAVVDRPQDIEDEAAMRFFGGEEGDADLSQGWICVFSVGPRDKEKSPHLRGDRIPALSIRASWIRSGDKEEGD